MKDSQILSAFSDLPDPRRVAAARRQVLLFDACQVGVVLRAVLFVESVVGVGAMFGAADTREWLVRVGILSGAALPATLAWLVVACSLKRLLARLPAWGQHVFGIALGALAGVFGCGQVAMVTIQGSVPWVACAFSGALLASALMVALVLRAKGRMPAQTAARLSELQARIQPHFLFNTLNSAIALVREDPARAETILEDLSDLFRHALTEQGEAVTLKEEVALARRYLAIEEVRFGDRLRVEWSIDPAAGSAKVPPLFLQPLVENAVKHGVEPSANGAEVKISTQRRAGTVVIKVTNTVPAGQGRPGHGVAQDNVRDRLRLLHDLEAQFRTVLKDGIYQVRMEVPG
ncbi:sensor histidine kinase [Ramlibacter henchirensis]|uniref:Sensor histidine kinase n=1 Tax=Ramlibacter henchirensis TaxID=204072 RepID=A0A4Z0BUG9_9BURK|nr:histidine kinase [Ramlibacter henchirensis]TFZ02481.1 sensor histidine kinase [Ramlibacter henchirensis]